MEFTFYPQIKIQLRKYSSLQNTSLQGITGCLKSDPESYLCVFKVFYLISKILTQTDIDTSLLPTGIDFSPSAILKRLQEKINDSSTIPAIRLDLQLFLVIYFFYKEDYQGSFDLLQECYKDAKREGMWLWALKASHTSQKFSSLIPANIDIQPKIDYEKQHSEILAQLSESLVPELQIRMNRHYSIS